MVESVWSGARRPVHTALENANEARRNSGVLSPDELHFLYIKGHYLRYHGT